MSGHLKGLVATDDPTTKTVTVTENGNKVLLDVNVASSSGSNAADPALLTATQNIETTTASSLAELQTIVTNLATVVSNQTSQITELTNMVAAQNAANTTLTAILAAQADDATEAKQDSQITELQNLLTELEAKADQSEKQSVGELHALVPMEHDRVTITSKNANGDPLIVEYREGAVLVATLTLIYDVDGDFQDVVRS